MANINFATSAVTSATTVKVPVGMGDNDKPVYASFKLKVPVSDPKGLLAALRKVGGNPVPISMPKVEDELSGVTFTLRHVMSGNTLADTLSKAFGWEEGKSKGSKGKATDGTAPVSEATAA
jgi:hypothetical protein